jgi:hypothetical protein
VARTLTEKSTREKERRGESRVISIMERTDDRSGRRVRAIRVYTLCQESRYVFRFHLVADVFCLYYRSSSVFWGGVGFLVVVDAMIFACT